MNVTLEHILLGDSYNFLLSLIYLTIDLCLETLKVPIGTSCVSVFFRAVFKMEFYVIKLRRKDLSRIGKITS